MIRGVWGYASGEGRLVRKHFGVQLAFAAPSLMVSVDPASAVPVRVGVVSLVMASFEYLPVSEPVVRSGVDGACGAVASTVRSFCFEKPLFLPWASPWH